MDYHIELRNCDTIHTAVVKGRVEAKELSKFVPAACGEVWSYIRSAGLPRPGRHTALYLADGSVEAGAEMSQPFAGGDRVCCSHLPAGRVATTAHFGPYAQLAQAHRAIRHWCAEHNHQVGGICWEIYGHWEESWNADASKIRTDVFHLLQE